MNINYKFLCIHKDGFTAEFEDCGHLKDCIHGYTDDYHNLYAYVKSKIDTIYMLFNIDNKLYKFKIDPYEAFNYAGFIHYKIQKSDKRTIIEFFETLDNYYNYDNRKILLFDFIHEFTKIDTVNRYCY